MMILLLVYLFIALFFSFICSIMEAVLLSTPQSFLVMKSRQGHKWADTFIHQKKNIDKPLSAILSLNTVAHTIGAAGVGAQAIKVFGDAYFGVISVILTLLILVITEIIPKTIGASYPKYLASSAIYIIQIMIFITYPLVILSSFVTKLISPKNKEKLTSREEISALTELGANEGLFLAGEQRIIQNILRLKNVKATTIMTPRVVVDVADEKMLLSEFRENGDTTSFSRIPVYSENEENITGYVLRKDIFDRLTEGKEGLRLVDIKREIIVVPDSMALFSLWNKLLERKEHIALIVDEYGGMDGIVTMEDVIETMLGLEIMDEKDEVTDMQKYARQKWLERNKKHKRL